MGLEEAKMKRLLRRASLTVQELNSRIVPAVLVGLEADLASDVEQYATAPEDSVDGAPLDGTAIEGKSIEGEAFDGESWAWTTFIAEPGTTDFAEPAVYKGDDASVTDFGITESGEPVDYSAWDEASSGIDSEVLYTRPIMPYYRTLTAEPEDSILYEGPTEELYDKVEDGSEITDLEVVNDFPVIYYMTARGDDLEVPGSETPTELEGEEYFDPAICYMAGPGVEAGAGEVEGGEYIDPAVCYMAGGNIIEPTSVETAETEEVTEESLVSAFNLDDFLAEDSEEITEEVELTQEVLTVDLTSPEATGNNSASTTTVSTSSDATDNYSADGDSFDFYFGVSGPVKKNGRK